MSRSEDGRSIHERALAGFRDQADRAVMVNATRANYVEYQIAALLDDWETVGDWDGWDLQRGDTRLEVKGHCCVDRSEGASHRCGVCLAVRSLR